MAADFARPNIGNKIKEDILGLYDILQALATGATQGTVNTPTGTLNFYIDGNNMPPYRSVYAWQRVK